MLLLQTTNQTGRSVISHINAPEFASEKERVLGQFHIPSKGLNMNDILDYLMIIISVIALIAYGIGV